MSRLKVEVGTRCGSLVVTHIQKQICYCLCDCGESHVVSKCNFASGNTKRCKKCQKTKPSGNRQHGLTGHKVYYTWQAMKRRCDLKADIRFQNYGGRGITYCERWKDFNNFLSDMGMPPTPNHTLERVDVNGNYSPENCVWATITEQANNKTNNILIEFDGVIKTLPDWCRDLGISYPAAKRRYYKNSSPKYVLFGGYSNDKAEPKYKVDGSFYRSLSAIAKVYEMSLSGCNARIQSINFPDWEKI